jgi:hypothetical protein
MTIFNILCQFESLDAAVDLPKQPFLPSPNLLTLSFTSLDAYLLFRSLGAWPFH